MRHFLRLAVLVSIAAGVIPAQFHLPGLSSGGSPSGSAAPKPATPSSTPAPGAPPATTTAKPPAATAPPAAEKAGVDYYALSIAWPSGKPVVTGFAPRANEGASPESCGGVKPASKAAMSIVSSLMVGQAAIQQEWMKHGSCTGFTAAEYFNAMRYARSLVQIPVQLTSPDEDTPKQTPQLIEVQFASANADYPPGAFQASVADVRICFSAQFRPQACPLAGSPATGLK